MRCTASIRHLGRCKRSTLLTSTRVLALSTTPVAVHKLRRLDRLVCTQRIERAQTSRSAIRRLSTESLSLSVSRCRCALKPQQTSTPFYCSQAVSAMAAQSSLRSPSIRVGSACSIVSDRRASALVLSSYIDRNAASYLQLMLIDSVFYNNTATSGSLFLSRLFSKILDLPSVGGALSLRGAFDGP